MLVNRKQVEENLGNVTPDQIGRCTKIHDCKTRTNFYLVASESEEDTEHKVTYCKRYGFQCTCPSGTNGFSNVKHPSGVCKHVRWAVAAAREEKAYIEAMKRKHLEDEGIISLGRLNDYQELAMIAPDETMRASARRIVAQILKERKDVALVGRK